jgi:adsorption protein B
METILRDIIYFFQLSHDVIYVFAFVVAVFLLLSGIDDFAVDLYYWFNRIFRRKMVAKYEMLSPDKMEQRKEKPIAIFIPTWQEEAVIKLMLKNASETIEYENYDIFVGVYPNDPATKAHVIAASRLAPHRIHPVLATHPGPSTKAQNLNDIYEGMVRWENMTGIRYDVIILHDAEDLIHPLSLKAFNYFVPQHDMVQIPVYPLETAHRHVVHWTYCDEFAENHSKDLVARQMFSNFVPSAGVGTAYNRWVIEFIGTSFARNMFNRNSLTEDYDVSLRLALGEARLLYLHQPFGKSIATRAYFPHTFTAAVRQKTRWLIGICLQGWRNYGWKGDFRFRLTLYRDRKAVVTNIVNALAYVVLLYVLLYELGNWALREYGTLEPVVATGTLLWYIVLVDTGLMLWRFVHRFLSVNRVYGTLAALLSIPRLPVSNVINFTATVRAITQFFQNSRRNEQLAWDKTTHTFPTVDEPVLYN